VPAMHAGMPEGFKVYAIRPTSFYAHLNLMNGDTVRGINGFELVSTDKFNEVLPTLRTATKVTLDILRHGQPMILTIDIQ